MKYVLYGSNPVYSSYEVGKFDDYEQARKLMAKLVEENPKGDYWITEEPIKLTPRYFPPDKGGKPMFHDWPAWKDGKWLTPIHLGIEDETEEEGLARIERKVANDMEDAKEAWRERDTSNW